MLASHSGGPVLVIDSGPDYRSRSHKTGAWSRLRHNDCTCKMGPSTDPDAVVDATGAVHGLAGLYVCDASIMPDITRGNINLPTAMIGARVAAGLLELDPAHAVTPFATPA